MRADLIKELQEKELFEDLRQAYMRIIETHQVPHADNIKALSAWLIYVYYGRLISEYVPDKKARIIDWGGLYGQVSKILNGLDYPNVFNYLLHHTPDYPLFQEAFALQTLWGRAPNRLELEDRSVDGFISSGVLEHVREDGVGDERLILREIYRVLKTGGLLFIWNLPARWGSSELLARVFNRWHHPYCFQKREILDLLRGAGFHLLYWDKHKFLPGTMMEWLGQWIDPVRLLIGDDRLSHWFPFHLLARDYALIAEKREDGLVRSPGYFLRRK
jgi:SAM-dependent methyltransferase